MKFTKLSLAMASVMGAGLASEAMALDLYVDTKTQQIYAEPGRGRVLLGEFQRVGEPGAAGGDAALKAEVEQIKQDMALKDNELKALDEHMKEAEKVKIKMGSKGVEFESEDKEFKFRIGGRIHADANYSTGDSNLVERGTTDKVEATDGTEIRRARMEMVGTFWKDWEFKSQFDFADNKVGVKDLFVSYQGIKDWDITVGQQKQAFSRELQESSNDLVWMERSLMDALNAPVVDRAIGVNVGTFRKDWTGQLGFYGDTIAANGEQGVEGWGVNSRWTFAPINEKTKVVHLGIAGNYREPGDSGKVNDKSVKFEAETDHMSNLYLVNTGTLADVNNITSLGLEANGVYGPFYGGGEFTQMWLSMQNGEPDLDFNGWYAEAAYTITGESRKYKKGKFYKVSPKNRFSLKNGGWGAWEVASRISGVDLNSANVQGGEETLLTLALNWYLNDNIRFMADYNYAFSFENPAVTTTSGGNPDVSTFSFRTQLAF
ncbi:OprO/OprP family phosphate-selective porin [Methylomonas sp. MgM2]